MDDMTPTDKLRTLLDEHGIEHDDNDANTEVTGVRITRWKNGGKRDVRYEEWRNGTTRLDAGNVSPEQAITATIGDGEGGRDEWRSVALGLFDSLEKADLEEAKRWICDNNLLRQEIAYGDADAATVGVGTCEGEIDTDYFECKLTTFECKNCGWSGVVDSIYPDYSFDGTNMPRHCPNCGKRIREETE